MANWTVTADIGAPQRGILQGPLLNVPCALGRSGVIPASDKKEGDGFTPTGRYPLRCVYYRPDRLAAPVSCLPVDALSADYGWCDDPDSSDYNKLVRLPYGRSHEKLWRDDHVYDVILVIGHNDAPVVPGKGSAVFVHIAREKFTPTSGCVALQEIDFLRFLRQVKPDDMLAISGGVYP